MEIYSRLRNHAQKDDWQESIQWLAWTAIGGLLPIWGTLLLLNLLGSEINIAQFMDHGEFALYAAAFASPSLGLVMRNFRKSNFPSRGQVALLLVIILLAACLTFGAVSTFSFLKEQNIVGAGGLAGRNIPDPIVIRVISGGAFLLSLPLSLFIVVADKIGTGIDFREEAQKPFDRLKNDLEGWEGDND